MKIYVGTYAKYNAGSIKGAWLDLGDYEDKDAFIEACLELHKDEHDPELMFQDWEGIPDGLISESHISPEAWEVLKAFEEHDEGAVRAFLYLQGEWDKERFEEMYRGEYESWEAMAEDLLEETGEINEIPEGLRFYFDYEKYARDLRLNGDFVEHEGYFFWGG